MMKAIPIEPRYEWTERQHNQLKELESASKLLAKAGYGNKITKYFVFTEEDSVGVIELT